MFQVSEAKPKQQKHICSARTSCNLVKPFFTESTGSYVFPSGITAVSRLRSKGSLMSLDPENKKDTVAVMKSSTTGKPSSGGRRMIESRGTLNTCLGSVATKVGKSLKE